MAAKAWRFSEFKHQMQSIDIDDWINALKNFIAYLQTGTDFSEFAQNEQIFNIVINCLDHQTYVISEPIKQHDCLQVLLLLSTRISISNLNKFIDKIIKRALESQGDSLISNYALLVADISKAMQNSDKDRKETYINNVLKKCLEYIRPISNTDDQIFAPMIILTSVIENLGALITKQQFTSLYKRITTLIDDNDSSYLKELVSLSKIFAIYANSDLLQQYINFLIKYVDNENDKAFTILANLVISKQDAFHSQINYLANLFFQNMDLLTQKYAENIDVTSQELKKTELSINALNALVQSFSSQFASTVDVYSEVAFDLFTYGVDAPVFTRSSEIQSVPESDFESYNEDPDIFGNDDIEDDDVYVDESYTIRKAINVFAQTIIKYFPDIFLQTFLSNEKYQTYTLNFIVDPDTGSKSASLQTLLLFVKSCKSKISELVSKNWIHAFINEINIPTQKCLSILYSSFADFLLEFPNLVSKYSLLIMESLKKIQEFYQQTQSVQKQQAIHQSLLELIDVLISKASNIDEISPLICDVTIPLMKENNQSNYQTLFYTYSLLFSRISSKSSKAVINLNKKIIDFAKSDSLYSIYTIDPLSIYISVFSNSDKEGSSASLKMILDLAKRSASYNKNVLISILLIASSQSKKILLSSTKVILSIIQNGISDTLNNPTLLFNSLMALDSCIKDESLFNPKECNSIVPSVASLLSFNDNRVRKVVVRVLNHLSSFESVSSAIIPKLKDLFDSNDTIPAQIIEEIAEALAKAKDQELSKVINTLIEDGKKLALKTGLEMNCSNIALFIGCISSSKKDLREKILKEFSKEISNADKSKINTFSIRCIGEIGFRFSLADNQPIVDRILELVQCDDRLIFSAATHSCGLIAANATAIKVMLPQIIEKMKKDADHRPTWLNVLAKCLKRRQRISTKDKFDLSDLFGYLVSQEEYSQETETTYLDCFNSILILNPPLISSYFEKISQKNKASGILSSAIADYIENSLQTAEKVEPILKKILPYLDPNNPLVCTGAILSVKNSIKYDKLLPIIISKFSAICKCTEVNDNQFTEIFYGAPFAQKIDIGRPMRSFALETISSLFSIVPEKIDIKLMISTVTKATNDPINEIKSKALSIIVKACDNQIAQKEILDQFVPTMSNINFEDQSFLDIQDSYIQLIAKLNVITRNMKVIAIDKVASSVPNKSLLQKYENDFNQETQLKNQDKKLNNNLNSKLICYQLMCKYNKEAAEIYVS